MIEKEINQAIKLLTDDNLVWSEDMESIRHNLAGLLTKAIQVEFNHLEPEIGDIALNLIREGELDAIRQFYATTETSTMQSENTTEPTEQQRCRYSCCCSR